MVSDFNAKIFLKDAQGRVLQKQDLYTCTEYEFDVEILENGVYFLEMQLLQGKSVVYQFQIKH